MNKVLMVAFHFPPFMGGSGVLRTLKFCRYLPDLGWAPIILSANPRVFPHQDFRQLNQISPDTIVYRAFSLDSKKHLAIRGIYPRVFALPDRWVTWWLGGVWRGLKILKEQKPRLIWSTYPIATASLIGLTLHRVTGIPWVADFRDSMTEENYPSDPLTRKLYRWIEAKVMEYCTKVIFTTPSTRELYLKRYPGRKPESMVVIENGYDEEDFQGMSLEDSLTVNRGKQIRLLHTGVIYPGERNPIPFFGALARLKEKGIISEENIRIDLRASGSENHYGNYIKKFGIEDLIHFLPLLPYEESLKDAKNADVLLLLQGSCCNHQIPAKVYEYLRLQRPILALTDWSGDTASVLKECGGATIIDMLDEDELFEKIPQFLKNVEDQVHSIPSPKIVEGFSRQRQTGKLAKIFQDCVVKI